MKRDLEAQIAGVKNDLHSQITEVKNDLAKGINQAQFLATGAPLVLINDPKKYDMMQQRLKAFAACVRGDGGDECIKGKR